MLTPRQKKLLDFIEDYSVQYGRSPSYREMRDALGAKSTSSIFRLMIGLEGRGFIERSRIAGAARSIKILQPQTHLNPEYLRGYQDGYEAAKAEDIERSRASA